jgi:hypothetical protein
MPESPENGVTNPARRNRTRSINRPSVVTSFEASEPPTVAETGTTVNENETESGGGSVSV